MTTPPRPPPKETLSFAKKYENAQKGQLIVKRGETLPTIAKKLYGQSESWKVLWRENDRVENPNQLEPGMVLYYTQRLTAYSGVADDPYFKKEGQNKFLNREVAKG